MTSRANQIGISQRIRLEWLEVTANLVLAGSDRATVVAALGDLLEDKVSIGGHAERSNREKVITILVKVWAQTSRELDSLRAHGLELLRRLSPTNRLPVHWGMVMAAYPFWGAVASIVGRLLKLQGSAAAAHVQRRVREQYGERETVSRACRRVLRSYVDWGVLRDSNTKGVYLPGLSLTVDDPQLISWLVEAWLYTRPDGTATLKHLLHSPSLFPFRFQPALIDTILPASGRLEVLRLGLDQHVVTLRR
ncbi:MAG: hypothetical protein AB1446_05690 [Bacillota bacterium]